MLQLNTIHLGDCLELMKDIPDKSINLIVIDPPYNIGKDKRWDKWKTVQAYVEWMGSVFTECQRVLKDNGSFYFFHNDFLQIVGLQNWINQNTSFVFKQFITWNKKFNGAANEGFLQGFNEVEGLRNYQQMAEYCLFYTFQDETGLTTVMLDVNNFSTLRRYFKSLQEYLGMTKKEILERVGQRADHCFRWGSSQWDMPTPETYEAISSELKGRDWSDFREYESLRQEYESLRYTFNNQKEHHSVMNFEVAKKQGHMTPKPEALIETLIKYSSNPDDTVLDCFMGSGTTAIACMNTGRNFIGIEKDSEYHRLATERVQSHELSYLL